ncbi:MAG: hypothetical protein SFZ03_11900 [Candidatus Melainabacteria bacterium]|nr:hypothetical protein [Candidatus Melainabacteria bacterium]
MLNTHGSTGQGLPAGLPLPASLPKVAWLRGEKSASSGIHHSLLALPQEPAPLAGLRFDGYQPSTRQKRLTSPQRQQGVLANKLLKIAQTLATGTFLLAGAYATVFIHPNLRTAPQPDARTFPNEPDWRTDLQGTFAVPQGGYGFSNPLDKTFFGDAFVDAMANPNLRDSAAIANHVIEGYPVFGVYRQQGTQTGNLLQPVFNKDAPPVRRLALIIGDVQEHPKDLNGLLTNAAFRRTTRALYETLQKEYQLPPEHILLSLSPARPELLRDGVNWLIRQARQTPDEPVEVLIYYVGHSSAPGQLTPAAKVEDSTLTHARPVEKGIALLSNWLGLSHQLDAPEGSFSGNTKLGSERVVKETINQLPANARVWVVLDTCFASANR